MGWRHCSVCKNYFNDTAPCPRCDKPEPKKPEPEPKKPEPEPKKPEPKKPEPKKPEPEPEPKKPEPEPEPKKPEPEPKKPEPEPEPEKPKLEPKAEVEPEHHANYAGYLEHLEATAKAEVALRASVNGVHPVAKEVYVTYEKLCKNLPMLLRGSAREAVVEQLYSRVKWTGRVAIAVYTEERQGSGDMTLGLKTTELYRQALNCRGQYDVAFVTDKRTYGKLGNMPAGYGIQAIQLPEGDHFTGDARRTRVQALVRAPVLTGLASFEKIHSYTKFICDTTQMIGFTEYAKEESDAIPSGLKAKELGITINQELRAYQIELLDQAPIARPAFRLRFLSDVADPIFNAIVGPPSEDPEHLKVQTLAPRIKTSVRPFSVDLARERDVDGARGLAMVIEDKPDARLYFGYTNRSGTAFVKILVAVEAGKPGHVCVVHPSGHYFDNYWPDFWKEINGPYASTLEKAGFGAVEVIEITDTVEIKYCPINKKSPRILRLVLPKRVRPQDMAALFKASEPIAMVTGNQSTSEALSAGKTLIYECLSFKQNQQFMTDLFDLGEVAVGNNKTMKTFFTTSKKVSQWIIDGKGVANDKDCEAVAQLLVDAKMEAGFHSLSELACTTKDLRDRLVGMYIRARLHRDPDASRELCAAESEVRGHTAEVFETFFASLTRIVNEISKG